MSRHNGMDLVKIVSKSVHTFICDGFHNYSPRPMRSLWVLEFLPKLCLQFSCSQRGLLVPFINHQNFTYIFTECAESLWGFKVMVREYGKHSSLAIPSRVHCLRFSVLVSQCSDRRMEVRFPVEVGDFSYVTHPYRLWVGPLCEVKQLDRLRNLIRGRGLGSCGFG